MAIAATNGTVGHATGASTVTTTAITSAASGSSFIVYCQWDHGLTFSTISDSKSNTPYVLIGSEIDNTTGLFKTRLYYFTNGTGGASHTFTFTVTGGTGALTILACEITGGATSSLLDQSNQAVDTSSPYTSGATPTTTNAADLLLGAGGGESGSNPATHSANSAGGTPTTGWTNLTGASETDGSNYWTCFIATQSVAATGAYTFGFTESGSSKGNAHIAALKELAGGGGGRTTHNTRSHPLGAQIGYGWRVPF